MHGFDRLKPRFKTLWAYAFFDGTQTIVPYHPAVSCHTRWAHLDSGKVPLIVRLGEGVQSSRATKIGQTADLHKKILTFLENFFLRFQNNLKTSALRKNQKKKGRQLIRLIFMFLEFLQIYSTIINTSQTKNAQITTYIIFLKTSAFQPDLSLKQISGAFLPGEKPELQGQRKIYRHI